MVNYLGLDIVGLLLALQLRPQLARVHSLFASGLGQVRVVALMMLRLTLRMAGALLPPGRSMTGLRMLLFVLSQSLGHSALPRFRPVLAQPAGAAPIRSLDTSP